MPESLEQAVNTVTADTTVTTTTETVAVISGPVKVPAHTCLVHIRAWCQLTLGTATTAVTPRIRRGSGITGTVLGDAVAEAIKTAAGSTEPFVLEVMERRSNEDTVEYAFTVQQTGATGNGTVAQAGIAVTIMSG
jgi:hypothetical protein